MNELNTQSPTPNSLHSIPDTQPPSPKPKILIVDDDEGIRTQLKWLLDGDYEVFMAEDRRSAVEILVRERPWVVMLDLGLEPHPQGVEEGMLTLDEMIQQDAFAKVIIITGRAEREHALKAISSGAYDFLCKPIKTDELKVILKRAVHLYGLEEEHRKSQRGSNGELFEKMLGSSPQMQAVFEMIRKVATTDAPVLIVGESGTGKELTARAIHRQSIRREGSFVVINCGAIPDALLESELFGHEKGAFTGAHIQRKGRIELASGGTLLLDEIGELSPGLQVKLLRFLEENRIERVGGREQIAVNARVIAATNADLKKAMKVGTFREDLFYRLSVVNIVLAPLRERRADIMLQAEAMQQRYAAESKKKIIGFSPQALTALQTHSWPGNTRELDNRIKRAVIMTTRSRLTPADLELTSPSQFEGRRLKEARESVEKELIQQVLAKYKGNIAKTASDLGLSRPSLYDRMQKLSIQRE